MAPSLALSKSDVLARNLATSLNYPKLPRHFTGRLAGDLDLPEQSKALDAAVVLYVYHLLLTAYNGGRRFLTQLNEYALHAAWAPLCTKLASLSPVIAEGLQLRSALLPGEAADRLGIDLAAGSKGSHGIRVSSEGVEATAAPLAGASAQPPATSASSALNRVNYRREGFVEAKDLARGRIEFQVGKVAGGCKVVRGAHELKDDLAVGFEKTVQQVEKELLGLFVMNVKLGSPQRRIYIFLTDASLAIVYCLEVDNYNTWQLRDGYDKIRGRIMHSRVLHIEWGVDDTFEDPPSYDSLIAVSYMIQAFVPEIARASLQQVQEAAAQALTMDASESFESVQGTLMLAVKQIKNVSEEARADEAFVKNKRLLRKRKQSAEDVTAETATADATAKMLSNEELMLKRVIGAEGNFAGKMMPGIIEGYINTLELHLQSMRELKQEAEALVDTTLQEAGAALAPQAQPAQHVDG